MKSPLRFLSPRSIREASTTMGGQEARKKAESELARVRSETSYYERLGSDLKRLRERNHFADSIRATVKGA